MSEPPRFAALDVGSNTVKLLIAERNPDGTFNPLFEEAQACRLGEGFARKRLKKAAIDRTLSALKYFLLQCRRHDVESIAAIGTSALRDAANSTDILDPAREMGIPLEVIIGDEEARLSYLAVRRDPQWRDAQSLLIVDIGGGSTELAWGSASDSAPNRVSLQVGAVRLTEHSLPGDPPAAESVAAAARAVSDLLTDVPLPESPSAMTGVGGTCSNIGAVAAASAGTPERVHGRRLKLAEVESQVELYAALPVEQRKRIQGLDPARADIILAGAIILRQAIRRAGVTHVDVSNRGLRWGLLYDRFGM